MEAHSMQSAASQIFETLSSYVAVENMIESADSEGLHLECKAPTDPRLVREQKAKLAQAISGFANTAGGVIVWGVSTTKHEHSGLDVITQVEPIARIGMFADQVEKAVPTLTTPPILNSSTKVLKRASSDSKGVAVTIIPKAEGDPVQSNLDNLFYFRSGDEFVIAPYEMIRRLFSATQSPDLHAVFHSEIVTLLPDGRWEIPIAVRNDSSAIAENVVVYVSIANPDACENIECKGFRDVSSINPGKRVFSFTLTQVVHRGLNEMAGSLLFKMKVARRAKRNLGLSVTLYANRMRARRQEAKILLAKKGFSVLATSEVDVY
jgi:hypothetical protein